MLIATTQKASHSAPTDFQKTDAAICNSLQRVYVCVTHSLRPKFIVVGDMFMKRLIVLAALATLLGSVTGCSMLNRSGIQPCETCDSTSPEPLLSRLRLPRVSLPWRRARDLVSDSGDCQSCNEGFTEVGAGQSNYYPGTAVGEYGGSVSGATIVSGPIEGQIVGEAFMGVVNQPSNTLYHPEVVGPTGASTSTTTSYVGELIPPPHSPTVLDLGK